MKLSEAEDNHNYRVIQMDVDPRTKKRLQDMGITNGVMLKLMYRLGKHASVMRVRGSRVALSIEISSKITVAIEDDNSSAEVS